MTFRNSFLFVTTVVMLATMALTVSAQSRRAAIQSQSPRVQKYGNDYFYKADGSFDEAKAKRAYTQLFRYHNYSIARPILAASEKASLAGDKLWILDFNIGDFSNVGMGGIFFVNDKEHGYFGHEIYLLPYQMIPQHQHMEAEGKAPKHESWQVRHGSVWCFAEGGSEADLASLPLEAQKALKSQIAAKAIDCFKAVELKPGDMALLSGLTHKHFMLAGPEGAIVTEYASYHSGEGLVFSHKEGKAANSPAKKVDEKK
ncbi:MAG: hypothetical protein LBU65_17540 [Planctomycetaceae bacterium]|nr:hypothetical protein [Planctomycetaceae bacterium]